MTYISNTATCTPANPMARRGSLVATLIRFLSVAKQRRSLKSLDDAALADIGLTRKEADAESRRSFWDAPETWRN